MTMSSRNLPVVIAPRARQDYDDILLYSLHTWGEEQQRRYDQAILRALRNLGAYPYIGRQRDDLGPGYRSHPVEQHIIYYHVDVTAVTVIRILHAKMNPIGRLGP